MRDEQLFRNGTVPSGLMLYNAIAWIRACLSESDALLCIIVTTSPLNLLLWY